MIPAPDRNSATAPGRGLAQMYSNEELEAAPMRLRDRLHGLWARWGFATVGAAFLLLVGVVGTAIIDSRFEQRRKFELMSFGSLVQTRLTRDLGNALFLTGGLKSYLTVREGVLNSREVNAILARLYEDSRHVR